jgi:glycosyltransferase involved in cell wall biosynthesis
VGGSAPRLSLLVPAYNEVATIGSTLVSTRRFLDSHLGGSYEILVGADGDDGTREVAGELAREDPRVSVFGTPERRGKGRAIREGVGRARGELVAFIDADYKTPIEELPKLLVWLDAGYDVVIGSRGLPDSRVEVRQPLHRRLGSRGFGLAMHALVGLRDVHDTQCGFKAFRGAVARDLFSRQRVDGYMFDVEVLYLAARSGYRMKEVGIRWRDDGDSRLELVAGNWRNLLDLFRIRFGAGRTTGPAATVRDGVAAERPVR